MTHSAPLWRVTHGGAALLTVSLLLAPGARAQATGDGFLFRRPRGSLSIWTGYDRALANSPIFQFVTDTFTLSKSSFGAFAIGGDLAFTVAPRLELMFSAGWAGSKSSSAYRNWTVVPCGISPSSTICAGSVGTGPVCGGCVRTPIQQTTALERVPLTASLKWYLTAPGEAIGHFAWVPTRYAPFVGVGGGLMWYRFQQYGRFVDYADNTVANDAVSSDQWTGEVHAFAGVDVALGPRYILTGRAQYTWAKSTLGSDFVGPNSVDLSGLSITAGLGFRF